MIDVIFLGTGSAVPTLKRNHPAILVKYKAEAMLFDCGEGTQKQFRKVKESPSKLTRLFITHWHGDHILGIPGLFQTLALNNYEKTLEVYGPKGTKHYLDRIMDMFIHRGEIKVNVHEVSSGKVFENEDYIINCEEMEHGANCLAYNFIKKDKLRIDKNKLKKLKLPNSPLLKNLKNGKDIIIGGKKIKAKDLIYTEKGKKLAIVLDTRINEKIVKISEDADLMICEATYFDETELAKEYKHLTVGQAADSAKKANVKKLVLMHLSQKYEIKEKEFLSVARKKFKNTIVAEDGMRVII
jgi:ribonuclease Z